MKTYSEEYVVFKADHGFLALHPVEHWVHDPVQAVRFIDQVMAENAAKRHDGEVCLALVEQ